MVAVRRELIEGRMGLPSVGAVEERPSGLLPFDRVHFGVLAGPGADGHEPVDGAVLRQRLAAMVAGPARAGRVVGASDSG